MAELEKSVNAREQDRREYEEEKGTYVKKISTLQEELQVSARNVPKTLLITFKGC